MFDAESTKQDFLLFKSEYNQALCHFLKEADISETGLAEGYLLGRKAVTKKISILSVAAIHHDSLMEYLETLASNDHIYIADKASLFLEEVVVPFHMVIVGFRDAISLLNKRSIEFALRIRDLMNGMKEKEALLKEVYHRVKNNLQVVTSLLHLQMDSSKDETLRKALLDNAGRIKSMALIHEMLYQAQNLEFIEMQGYITNLLRYLKAVFTDEIRLDVQIAPVELTIDLAIPCGLIINELVSNAYKYGAKDKESVIHISLKTQEQKIYLDVWDGGLGFKNMDLTKTPTLGIQLVQNLTKQIGGIVTFHQGKGAKVSIEFPI